GGVAAGADVPDELAGGDRLSYPDLRVPAHGAVAGDDAAGVADVDVPAAAADRGAAVDVARVPVRHVALGDHDDAGRGGEDRRVAGGAEVDAVVVGPVGGAEAGHDRRLDRGGPARCGDLAGFRADQAARDGVGGGPGGAVGELVDDAGGEGLVLGVCVRVGADLDRLRGVGQRQPVPPGDLDEFLVELAGLVLRFHDLLRR